jgi:hypothetical protein
MGPCASPEPPLLRRALNTPAIPSYLRVAQHWLTEGEVDAVVDKYDANGDGLIDLGEFVAVSQDAVFLQGHLAEYREAFRCVGRGEEGGEGGPGPLARGPVCSCPRPSRE